MKVVVVIQARMASTRLPGKVLLPLAGAPLLERMLERVRLAGQPDAIVVATTTDTDDVPIARICQALDVACFRGHPVDCLDRHVRAARAHHADAVVKVPSDCPMIDPAVIDRVIAEARARGGETDYVGNLHPATWPDGNDVEVVQREALERADREASEPFDREHTTPYIWSNPSKFRLHNVTWGGGRDLSRSHRWVIDWQADYELLQACFDALYPLHGPHFTIEDVLALHAARPELAQLNAAHLDYDYKLTRPGKDLAGHAHNP